MAASAADSPDLRITAQHALIAALAESDQIDDAWEECLRLAELITPDVNSQTAGKAYWGNRECRVPSQGRRRRNGLPPARCQQSVPVK